jgi:hypothetical protein
MHRARGWDAIRQSSPSRIADCAGRLGEGLPHAGQAIADSAPWREQPDAGAVLDDGTIKPSHFGSCTIPFLGRANRCRWGQGPDERETLRGHAVDLDPTQRAPQC